MAFIQLAAGPLRMVFDPQSGFLRHIKLEDVEVVRAIFVAVRDRNWDTIPFSLTNHQSSQSTDSFSLQFEATSLQEEIPFSWQGAITGAGDGTIEYRFTGLAQGDFQRNRIGLCVLHPIRECSGQPCVVEHVDGTKTETQFPQLISPDQPFLNMRAITHAVREDVRARVTLLGETFETEDQRNWTDASYKTYCTPLRLKFPVTVAAGTEINQAVQLTLLTDKTTAISARRSEGGEGQPICRIGVNWNAARLRPPIGFLYPADLQIAGSAVGRRLCQLRPDHFRADVHLEQHGWQSKLSDVLRLANECGASLEMGLFMQSDEKPALHELLALLKDSTVKLARVLVFQPGEKVTPAGLVAPVQAMVDELGTHIDVVVGTDAYFAELNRGRPEPVPGQPVCYSINPQVHAFDNLSLSETLEAQSHSVDSAANLFDSAVSISTVSLRPRFNPNATQALELQEELWRAIDPRQPTGFAASWVLGSLARLATHTKVASLTYFEAFGPRGILGADGSDYAMTQVFEHVLASRYLFDVTCDQPLGIVALAAQDANGQRRLAIGNLTEIETVVQYPDVGGNSVVLAVAPESVMVIPLESKRD
ncbi:MAG: hypothetical protein KDB22_14170 [Planctomycetales bacterium]|nr:hypothetical protein [Planctomycetales bacterium]